MMTDLSDLEINSICDGYTQSNAKVKFLERMGLMVRRKPNGKPLVNRNHYESMMNGLESRKPAPRGFQWSVPA